MNFLFSVLFMAFLRQRGRSVVETLAVKLFVIEIIQNSFTGFLLFPLREEVETFSKYGIVGAFPSLLRIIYHNCYNSCTH